MSCSVPAIPWWGSGWSDRPTYLGHLTSRRVHSVVCEECLNHNSLYAGGSLGSDNTIVMLMIRGNHETHETHESYRRAADDDPFHFPFMSKRSLYPVAVNSLWNGASNPTP